MSVDPSAKAPAAVPLLDRLTRIAQAFAPPDLGAGRREVIIALALLDPHALYAACSHHGLDTQRIASSLLEWIVYAGPRPGSVLSPSREVRQVLVVAANTAMPPLAAVADLIIRAVLAAPNAAPATDPTARFLSVLGLV